MKREPNAHNPPPGQMQSGGLADLVGRVGPGAALILGLIYAVGALVKTAELRNAGVDVGTAFPLIPIQQHLSRGIEIFLAPSTLAWLVGFFVIGAVVHRLPLPRVSSRVAIRFERGLLLTISERKSARKPIASKPSASKPTASKPSASDEGDGSDEGHASKDAETPERTANDKDSSDGDSLLVGLSLCLLLVFIFLTVSVHILLAIAVVVLLGGCFLLLTHSFIREPPGKLVWYWPTSALVVTLALMLGSVAVVDAFASSASLPMARLELGNGSTIDGQVVAATDQVWYLATARGHLQAVNASRVNSAVVFNVKPSKKTVLQDEMFQLLFPTAYRRVNVFGKEAERWFKSESKPIEHWFKRNRTNIALILIALFILFNLIGSIWRRLAGRPRAS